MTAKEAVKAIMKKEKVTLSGVSRISGEKRGTLQERMRRKSLSLHGALAILKAIDYKVVFMPANVRTPSGGVEVDEVEE